MTWEVETHRQITQLDLESPIIGQKKPINRFVLGSSLLHILSASAVVMLGQFPQPKPEIIEIDFSTAPIAVEASAPQPAPVIQEAAPAIIAPEPAAPVVKSEPSKAIAITSPSKNSSLPKTTPVAESVVIPTTLDDIETPTLDDSDIVAALQEQQTSTVSKQDLEKNLEAAQKAHAEKTAALVQQIDQSTDRVATTLDNQLNDTESAVAAQNAELIAQAEARAEALRAEAEAAAAANTATEGGQGTADSNAGPGNTGELRTLEQLRQMPGNPKPQYEPQERLQGQQGAVIFKAFVTEAGQLTNFKMLQSTGYRNLDFKTLKALKQWRFYPGQEGWVELPFKWDLKGGPKEMPTLLRRRVSQQN